MTAATQALARLGTTALPVPPTTALTTRHRAISRSVTAPPRAECLTCGPLREGGIYSDATLAGWRHVRETWHTVHVTTLQATTLRAEGTVR